MFGSHRAKRVKGFTLVELLIVVIILAVLASIVVPQFSSSTDDAKDAALRSTLTEMRNAIELYYHQHGATYPGDALAGHADEQQALLRQLTWYSNAAGQTQSAKGGAFVYGPYLKKQELPKNPIDGDNTVLFNAANIGQLTEGPSTAGTGWWYDDKNGKFLPNHSGYTNY